MTESQLNHELGRRIKAIRKARGITQATLAKAIRSSTPNIADIESGKNGVRMWRLLQIAAVFGVEPWQIIHPEWRTQCAQGVTEVEHAM